MADVRQGFFDTTSKFTCHLGAEFGGGSRQTCLQYDQFHASLVLVQHRRNAAWRWIKMIESIRKTQTTAELKRKSNAGGCVFSTLSGNICYFKMFVWTDGAGAVQVIFEIQKPRLWAGSWGCCCCRVVTPFFPKAVFILICYRHFGYGSWANKGEKHMFPKSPLGTSRGWAECPKLPIWGQTINQLMMPWADHRHAKKQKSFRMMLNCSVLKPWAYVPKCRGRNIIVNVLCVSKSACTVYNRRYMPLIDWLVVWNMFYFPIY